MFVTVIVATVGVPALMKVVAAEPVKVTAASAASLKVIELVLPDVLLSLIVREAAKSAPPLTIKPPVPVIFKVETPVPAVVTPVSSAVIVLLYAAAVESVDVILSVPIPFVPLAVASVAISVPTVIPVEVDLPIVTFNASDAAVVSVVAIERLVVATLILAANPEAAPVTATVSLPSTAMPLYPVKEARLNVPEEPVPKPRTLKPLTPRLVTPLPLKLATISLEDEESPTTEPKAAPEIVTVWAPVAAEPAKLVKTLPKVTVTEPDDVSVTVVTVEARVFESVKLAAPDTVIVFNAAKVLADVKALDPEMFKAVAAVSVMSR